MDMNNAFPSKYLGSVDFQNGPTTLAIAGVRMENVAADNQPQDNKPVLYVVGLQRGIVLNVTNNKALCAMFGGESDAWTNQSIQVYIVDTEYAGQPKKGIRIRGVPVPQMAPQSTMTPVGGTVAVQGAIQTVQQAFPGAEVVAPVAPPGAQPAGVEHTVDGSAKSDEVPW